jgi:hypothetical protein
MDNAIVLANLLGIVSAGLLVSTLGALFLKAYGQGKLAWLSVQFAGWYHVAEAEAENRRQAAKPVRLETGLAPTLRINPFVSALERFRGDVVRVFECAGCDDLCFGDQPGQVKVCDGLEFCSEDCHQSPQPMPTVVEITHEWLVQSHDTMN